MEDTLLNKIDRIDTTIQTISEDVIYIKAEKSPEKITALELSMKEVGEKLAALKSQVAAQWLIIGIVLAISAPIVLKGLGV